MLPTYNRNTNLPILFKWMDRLRQFPLLSFEKTRKEKANTNEEETAQTETEIELYAEAERKMFRGNFFAGPVALMPPALLRRNGG